MARRPIAALLVLIAVAGPALAGATDDAALIAAITMSPGLLPPASASRAGVRRAINVSEFSAAAADPTRTVAMLAPWPAGSAFFKAIAASGIRTSSSVALGHVPLCVAIAANKMYQHSATATGDSYTVAGGTVAAWLAGLPASAGIAVNNSGNFADIAPSQVLFVAPSCQDSEVCAAAVEGLAARGERFDAEPFRSTATAAVTDDEAAADLLATGVPSTTHAFLAAVITEPAAALRDGLRCAGVQLDSAAGAATIADSSSRLLELQEAAHGVVGTGTVQQVPNSSLPTGPAARGAVYPLWATAVTFGVSASANSIPNEAVCSATATHYSFIIQAQSVDSSLARRLKVGGIHPLSASDANAAVINVTTATCGASSAGSVEAPRGVPSASSWALSFNSEVLRTSPVTTVSSTDGTVGGEGRFARVLLARSSELETPSTVRIPLTGVAYAVVAHAPAHLRDGSVPPSLGLPRCLLPALLNGSIAVWNSISSVDAIPTSVVFPATAVRPVVFPQGHPARDAVRDQLSRLQRSCAGESGFDFGSFPLNQSNTTMAMLSRVLETPGSIAVVPLDGLSSAQLAGALGVLTVIDLIDERAGWASSVAQDARTQLAEAARAVAGDVSAFAARYPATEIPVGGYPLVGLIEADVVLHAEAASCVQYTAQMRFLHHVIFYQLSLSGSAAEAVPLPAEWQRSSLEVIRSAACNGAPVFPSENPDRSTTATIVVAVAVPLGLLTVVILSFVMLQWFKSATRDTANAPKQAPFAVVFTDIQMSTALWAQLPELMGEAVDAHHTIIRRIIRRHKCYEVKTIGDSFMVVTESPATAVKLANDIQKKLYEYDWGTSRIDRTYRELLGDSLSAMPDATPQQYRALWNGLRVRIGIDYGDGQVRFDTVSKGYDYYGTCVNAASRIEALGHGGQILASAEVMAALSESFLRDEKLYVDYIGLHQLRGLNEPVELFHLVPKRFFQREFDGLRMDAAGAAPAAFEGVGIVDFDESAHLQEERRRAMAAQRGGDHATRGGNTQTAYRHRGSISWSDASSVDDESPVPFSTATSFAGKFHQNVRGDAADEQRLPGEVMELEDVADGGTAPTHRRISLQNQREYAEQSVAFEYIERLQFILSACRPQTRSTIVTMLMREWQVEADGADALAGSHTSSSLGSGSGQNATAWSQEAELKRNITLLCKQVARSYLRQGSRPTTSENTGAPT